MKSDFRYTPESVFDTFPWPQAPTVKQIDVVATAAREVRHVRTEALRILKGGLRALYRTLNCPARIRSKTPTPRWTLPSLPHTDSTIARICLPNYSP